MRKRQHMRKRHCCPFFWFTTFFSHSSAMHISTGFYSCSFVLCLRSVHLFRCVWAYLLFCCCCWITYRIDVCLVICIFVHCRFLSAWKCVYLSFALMQNEETLWGNNCIFLCCKFDQVDRWFLFSFFFVLRRFFPLCFVIVCVFQHFSISFFRHTLSTFISRWNINICVFLDVSESMYSIFWYIYYNVVNKPENLIHFLTSKRTLISMA